MACCNGMSRYKQVLRGKKMDEQAREFKAFVNCELDEETVRQNVARVDPPRNDPPPRPITTDAVEAAAERLAFGSFEVVQRILQK